VLPMQASVNRILYARFYKAEIGGDDSRSCGKCEYDFFANPRMYYNFECAKPNRCTCTLCCKQPLSLKSAASKIVFAIYNMHKFCFDENTTRSEYVLAVRSGVIIPDHQLVPNTEFPCTLDLQYIHLDDFSQGQFHESCFSSANVRGSGKWPTTSHRHFENPAEFVNLVLHCKTQVWCTFCEKSLFVLPRRVPCQRLAF
jgi:hypothetical protein